MVEKMEVKVMPLGAGREVGRSCIIVCIGDVMVMCDSGMHMGYKNYKMFPDFAMIAEGDLTGKIDAVLISHFHLDHVGSLPVFTEKVGYSGPVIMTAPTHAIAPLLLEDFRNLSERRGGTAVWEPDAVKNCMKKVTTIGLEETMTIYSRKSKKPIKLTALYAGHVLGACMFHIEVDGTSVLYTGDYNANSDRHLLGAHVPASIRPNVVITESTYGSTIRDSKRHRERDYLQLIHKTVRQGGKVLIPVFALGRAQELLILIETFWKRMKLTVPIYFSPGMVSRANDYYKLYTSWTSDPVRNSTGSSFDFKSIQVFDKKHHLKSPGPCVLFSTPGMLHAGISLEAFKEWCSDEKNAVILPGYCVEGTIGHQVLTNENPSVEIDEKTYHVKCSVSNMPFSAHADARGILRLIQQTNPDHVVFVHGNYETAMLPIMRKVELETGIKCSCPQNGITTEIKVPRKIPIAIPEALLSQGTATPSIMNAVSELKAFSEVSLNHISKKQKPEPEKNPNESRALTVQEEKWWTAWGVDISELEPGEKPGASDIDCGCDIEYEKRLTTILASGPKSKYRPLQDGSDDWGTEETLRLVVVAGGSEDSATVRAEDAEDWMQSLELEKHDLQFKAEIQRKPLAGCVDGDETLICSIQTALLKCIPTLAPTSLEATQTTLSHASITLTYDAQRLLLSWAYPDKALALRIHSVIHDTNGVAF